MYVHVCTVKRAYRCDDGNLIETVLMPYGGGRNTACVSSQVGCAMGCVFCATGQMGLARQLTSDEIFEQAARLSSELQARGERLSNVVFMGMGEPLANYRNVMSAAKRMNDELNIGARKITISTVGVVPSIRRFTEEDRQFGLAVSLHSTNDAERTRIVPANKRFGGIDALMESVRDYVEETRRRVTFEWALIEGENDTMEEAEAFGDLLRRYRLHGGRSHVNVIPLNPTGGYGGSPTGRDRVGAFCNRLSEAGGVDVTPRMRRGIDFDAGCGQLTSALVGKKKRRAEMQARRRKREEREEREERGGQADRVGGTSHPVPPRMATAHQQ